MKLKVYFDVSYWTKQDNIFFWGNIPSSPKTEGSRRYVAEIEVPDLDADFDNANVSSVNEI